MFLNVYLTLSNKYLMVLPFSVRHKTGFLYLPGIDVCQRVHDHSSSYYCVTYLFCRGEHERLCLALGGFEEQAGIITILRRYFKRRYVIQSRRPFHLKTGIEV